MQIFWCGLPTHTWPRVASEGLGSSCEVEWKLTWDVVTWTELRLLIIVLVLRIIGCMRVGLNLVLALMIQSTHLSKDQRMDLFRKREGFKSFEPKHTSQTPRTQAGSDYIWWLRAFEYYIGVQELCLDPSPPETQLMELRKPSIVTSALKYFETGMSWLFAAERRNNKCASANSFALNRIVRAKYVC